MAVIGRLKVGQVLYQVVRQKCGNTSVSRGCLYTVKVTEIAEDGLSVMASWNGNKPRAYSAKQVAKLKVNRPKPKGSVMGMDSY